LITARLAAVADAQPRLGGWPAWLEVVQMDALNDIANRARHLAVFAPDSARDLLREMEGLRLYDHDENSRHAVRCYRENCREACQLINELTKLIYQHLPEAMPLKYIRINPHWRFDDVATDWPIIIAELQRIEDAALSKLVALSPIDDEQGAAPKRRYRPRAPDAVVAVEQLARGKLSDQQIINRYQIDPSKFRQYKKRWNDSNGA
jgi:hypothetical protein